MESIKMPSFSGNVREYAKFKADFKSQVEGKLDSPEALTYVLRSCLKEEAAYIVENVDDAEGIWERLDKRFGQPPFLIDVIMDEIRSIGYIRKENPEGFIKVVNTIEKGYAYLRRLKLEKEISNSVTVSMLEGRLPPIIKREWSKEVNKAESKIDPCNKFPSFMEFLKEQRTILEYEMANLRLMDTEAGEKHATINYGIRDPARRSDRINFRCNLHKMNNHWTEECRDYINKTPQEKIETIKSLKACLSCLKVGHRLNDCRIRKECSIKGCSMVHHPSLHDILATGAVNAVCPKVVNIDEELPSKCLLQIMKIRSISHDLSVLWDGGASISLITFRKAKELKGKGNNIELSVIKVGGRTERISSCLYTLPLVQRPNGEIDALIGFNYASLHRTMV